MNLNPNCDGSNCRAKSGPVRILPVTRGGSNLHLCQACHEHEMRWRRQRNTELSKEARFETPEWTSLPIYGEENGSEAH